MPFETSAEALTMIAAFLFATVLFFREVVK
jgi:hypothetical protein